MLIWKQIVLLRKRVRQQRHWIERCGGDLAGYIARYGDPGVPPLDREGRPQTVQVPDTEPEIAATLRPVPGQVHTYFLPHLGDGGSAIYRADCDRLRALETELSGLEARNFSARLKADEESASVGT